ncbi:MAG: lytic transglycosylase domain-containing protein [Halieaceae bacterium]|jgi:soluble lytic murein transglycosylase-like protein|nr:lytic transglycosylase domain-containing protein [Halieaceae bacterium]
MRTPPQDGDHKLAHYCQTLLLAIGLTIAAPTHTQDSNERTALRSFLVQTINDTDSFQDRYDAEVWLLDMSTRLSHVIQDPELRLRLLRELHWASVRANLSPELVLAIVEVESDFNRFAVSPAGAQGLMQVMPFWKNEIGRPDDNLTLIKTNLEYGCRILQFYLERKQGRLHEALAAYNGSGGSRRYSNKVYRAWDEHWRTTPMDWTN